MQHNIPTTALPSSPKINYIITKDKSKSDLAQYMLATAFSPAISTLKTAVDNGNFVTWPGINELNFEKLLGTTIPIEKVHMDQERKNLRSTSTDEHDDFPLLQRPKNNTNYLLQSRKTIFNRQQRKIKRTLTKQKNSRTSPLEVMNTYLSYTIMMITQY